MKQQLQAIGTGVALSITGVLIAHTGEHAIALTLLTIALAIGVAAGLWEPDA